jgi:hypothetical protein
VLLVVFDFRVLITRLGIRVFQVGQVNVNHAVQKPQHFRRIISVGVIDDGQTQATPGGQPDGARHLRSEVGRRDEVYVVTAALLQLDHHRG